MTDLSRNNLIHQPADDTWGAVSRAGAWCVTPRDVQDPSWLERAAVQTFEAFAGLARVWRVSIGSIDPPDALPAALEWHPSASHRAFLDSIPTAIRSYPHAIYSVECSVDLFAFSRPAGPHTPPVQQWLRLNDDFRFWNGEDDDRSACFSLRHTLFCPASIDGLDNRELYELNQPLLEHALRRWEDRLGAIVEFEGFAGIYQYGFHPEPGAEMNR